MVDIETLLADMHFSNEFCEDDFLAFCDYEETFSDIYHYDSGATKGVIIPIDEDYVIKIPFCGFHTCIFTDETNREEEEFENYYGAKTSLACYDWDYCLVEVERYDKAMKAGIADLFARTEIYGEVKGHPVYIQEKADPFCCGNHKIHTAARRQKTRNKVYSLGYEVFNEDWLTDVLDYFGEEIFLKLLSFIKKENINDLHTGNLGYIGDRPVIFDYSGYNE